MDPGYLLLISLLSSCLLQEAAMAKLAASEAATFISHQVRMNSVELLLSILLDLQWGRNNEGGTSYSVLQWIQHTDFSFSGLFCVFVNT